MTTSPLKNQVFRKLFSAQIIALFGTGLSTIALSLLALELGGEQAGLILGAALAIKMIAYVFLSPIFAALLIGVNQKPVLIILDLLRAACLIAMLFASQIWQVFILIFIINACSAGFTPLFQSIIPEIVKDDRQYTQALSLSRLAYDLENLISPMAAAALLTLMPWNLLFGLNAFAFLISALLVWQCRFPKSNLITKPARSMQEITLGISNYLKTPRLRGLLALSFAVSSAGAMVIVNSVVILDTVFSASSSELAFVFAAYGAGSMLIAILMPAIIDRIGERNIMLAGGVILAVGMFSSIAITQYMHLLIIWFALGAGNSAVLTPSGHLLKRSSHKSQRAQIFSAQFALSHLCWLITYPLAGWMGYNFQMQSAFLVMGLAAAISTLVAFWLWKPNTRAAQKHFHPELRHEHIHFHDKHHQHLHEGWEGPEPHEHPHFHPAENHSHVVIIDDHHHVWPR